MFDRVVIINLDRRPDRWLRMAANLRQVDWPFGIEPVRMAGFDGEEHPPPKGFGHTAGAWGCLQSHLMVCGHAIRDGAESLLIFEDDAYLPADFAERVRRFLEAVPDDWDSLYLGGQHFLKSGWPKPVNGEVLRGVCVLGTWAYALRGRGLHALHEALKRWPQFLTEDKFGVDRLLGALHCAGELTVYTPWRWCVHHHGGRSDTNGLDYRTYHFDMPDDVREQLRQQLDKEVLQSC